MALSTRRAVPTFEWVGRHFLTHEHMERLERNALERAMDLTAAAFPLPALAWVSAPLAELVCFERARVVLRGSLSWIDAQGCGSTEDLELSCALPAPGEYRLELVRVHPTGVDQGPAVDRDSDLPVAPFASARRTELHLVAVGSEPQGLALGTLEVGPRGSDFQPSFALPGGTRVYPACLSLRILDMSLGSQAPGPASAERLGAVVQAILAAVVEVREAFLVRVQRLRRDLQLGFAAPQAVLLAVEELCLDLGAMGRIAPGWRNAASEEPGGYLPWFPDDFEAALRRAWTPTDLPEVLAQLGNATQAVPSEFEAIPGTLEEVAFQNHWMQTVTPVTLSALEAYESLVLVVDDLRREDASQLSISLNRLLNRSRNPGPGAPSCVEELAGLLGRLPAGARGAHREDVPGAAVFWEAGVLRKHLEQLGERELRAVYVFFPPGTEPTRFSLYWQRRRTP